MAGFIPAVHVFRSRNQDVDRPDKTGHDGLHIARHLWSALIALPVAIICFLAVHTLLK